MQDPMSPVTPNNEPLEGSVQDGLGAGIEEALVAAPVSAHMVSTEALEVAASTLLTSLDTEVVTLKEFRKKLAVHVGLPEAGLDDRAAEVKALVVRHLEGKSDRERPDWLVTEEEHTRSQIALVTFAKVLAKTALEAQTPLKTLDGLTRENIRDAMLDAVQNPAHMGRGGRPQKEKPKVLLMVVVLEQPLNFHVASRFSIRVVFSPFKLALRQRSGLASHWSLKHTMLWSAVRYLHFATTHKPVVDETPLTWTPDGSTVNLYAESQENWCAHVQKRRREEAERRAAAGETASRGRTKKTKTDKAHKFDKLDFYALVIAEGLWKPSMVLAYTQKQASQESRRWVSRNQNQLPDLLKQAKQWRDAPEDAQRDAETEWALIQRLSKEPCQCEGGVCKWDKAAAGFFQRNHQSIDEEYFWHCLARIITEGPSKTVRVPLLAGPSNSSKSTLLDPIDLVFGPENVQHRPDLGASMPLVNLTKANKRFWCLDEFQLLEYATTPRPPLKPTIPVTTMLKVLSGQHLEVAASQSFNNGNPDTRWCKGIAITSKVKDLWEVRPGITEEDISHLKNRVEQFTATVALKKKDLRTTPPCKFSFCQRLVQQSAAFASRVSAVVLPVGDDRQQQRDSHDAEALHGMDWLQQKAFLRESVVPMLTAELRSLGVLSIQEMMRDDWLGLASWPSLQPFEQRWLLQVTGCA